MLVACIDMEGVLIPEMWPYIAQRTGISALALTTREVPDYQSLVERRIELLSYHKKKLSDIQNIVAELEPYEGARLFLSKMSQKCQVVLVSDAFYELVKPLWEKLGSPNIECHHFTVDENQNILAARYSRKGKHEVVERFKKRGFNTLAVGDAFNDIGMLNAADKGFLFRPSVETLNAAQNLPIAVQYDEILLASEPRSFD
jgi:phosphoserine/homoserine phosphotransferase